MDLKSNLTSPVLADTAPLNNPRLGMHTAMLPYSPNSSGFSSTMFLTIPRKKPGIPDDVWSSLFDAMKSSSPTHCKLAKEYITDTTISEKDVSYLNWMVSG